MYSARLLRKRTNRLLTQLCPSMYDRARCLASCSLVPVSTSILITFPASLLDLTHGSSSLSCSLLSVSVARCASCTWCLHTFLWQRCVRDRSGFVLIPMANQLHRLHSSR